MNDAIYTHLKKRYNEIYSIEPQAFRNTHLQRIFDFYARHLKTFPFRIFIPLSAIISIGTLLVLGVLLARLVTLLQYGF